VSEHGDGGERGARVCDAVAWLGVCIGAWLGGPAAPARGQSVCLPLPRLLTMMPMGGQAPAAGAADRTVELAITGEEIDTATGLVFSHPGLSARPVAAADGAPEKGRFTLAIRADVPPGVHEARAVAPLGVSSARAFTVGPLPELVRTAANISLATAFPLPTGTIVNAVATAQAIDHYAVDLAAGQRVVIDCAAPGIDSKLQPVLILADAAGRDLVVERRGGMLDVTATAAGRHVVKLHDLSFQGGPAFFYRLVIHDASSLGARELPPRQPATRSVHAFSWPPEGLPAAAAARESEPNGPASPQRITLPCDIAGRFFPAADTDVFEFEATKGEQWWIEVGSARLGAPTNPAVVVQRVATPGDTADAASGPVLVDVVELGDIPPPLKPSSNGYSYDGPPYDTGSDDLIGRLDVAETGIHRLAIRDLFGGTRDDPRSAYRLVIRRAAPDVALVGWGLHMELRNGDRAALSKPLALRGGGTVAVEVVALRRDGFDGPVELAAEGLPEGVTATGLAIPAGQSRGMILLTAAESAPQAVVPIRFVGRAEIAGHGVVAGHGVERPCPIASMAWPVRDASQEIPLPRLVADVVLSVGGDEAAPLSLRGPPGGPIEVAADGTLSVPLTLSRRAEMSGATVQMKTMGAGFEREPPFDVQLGADAAEARIDIAKLKLPPGDHTIAFYGTLVTKYAPAAAAPPATATAATPAPAKPTKPAATPTDIADILISEPITVRIKAPSAADTP